MYRPPKQSGKKGLEYYKYLETVEQELNDIVMWASLQKQSVVLLGDLNMDRLRPNEGEGKILKDLQDVDNLQCIITDVTRITPNSQTLLDVILTATPEMFKKYGTYDPVVNDHCLVYGVMRERVTKHEPKIFTFRDEKNTNIKQLNKDLLDAPWHVSEIFDDIDEKYHYWNCLLRVSSTNMLLLETKGFVRKIYHT